MEYEFYTVDVFTDERFGGNQLAVLPDAVGLTAQQMHNIACEFNYSECSFVLPPVDSNNTKHVRIFTPTAELPFAGHPNVGTAHVLARTGGLGSVESGVVSAKFEQTAGVVDIRVAVIDELVTIEVKAPRTLDVDTPMPSVQAAALLGIEESELGPLAPRYAESGVGYLLIEVADAEVLAKTVVNTRLLGGMHKGKPLTGIYAFTRNGVGSGNDIRARMYAPLQGINEDPATGSAACVLSAVLGNEQQRDGKHKLLIEQGIEMSRPSHLSARATIQGGSLNAIHLYGQCVDVMHGKLKT